MTPEVSHIILAYQQRELVEEAVRAACEQDFDSLEVVVADDGSTDGTAEAVDALRSIYSSRLVLLTGKNLGITGNSNRALSAVRGKLISIQGGDDILLPGKIRAQASWFAENPDAVLCGHKVENFTDDGAKTWVDPLPALSGTGAGLFVKYGPLYAATSVMVRREALPTRGFDSRLPLISDWKLWVDALAGGGRFGAVDQVLARYRIHAGGVTQARREQMMAERFMTLSLIECEYPHLAPAVQYARARLFYRRGVEALASGRLNDSRAEFRACLAQGATTSLRVATSFHRASVPTFGAALLRLRKLFDGRGPGARDDFS